MNEERIIKAIKASKTSLSWAPFWVAGWWFTLGLTGYTYNDELNFWPAVFEYILSFITWPMTLGQFLAG